MTDRFEWRGEGYYLVRRDGGTGYIAGWIGFMWDGPRWYARTAGGLGTLSVRAEFETKEEAMAFVQLLCNMENPDANT